MILKITKRFCLNICVTHQQEQLEYKELLISRVVYVFMMPMLITALHSPLLPLSMYTSLNLEVILS